MRLKNWLDLSGLSRSKSLLLKQFGVPVVRQRVNKVIMKKALGLSGVLVGLFMVMGVTSSFAQATYTSKVTGGNWNAAGTWTIGGTADGDGDGIPDANDAVIIIGNSAATPVVVNVASAALSLTYQANAISAYVTANASLTVTNAITYTSPTVDAMTQTLTINAVTVTCGSMAMVNTTNTSLRTNVVTVATGGTLTVNGNLTTPSTDANENAVTLNGTGQLNIIGTMSGAGGGTFTCATTSTVRWFGDNTNFRSDFAYGNLIVEIPSTATTSRTRTVANPLAVAGNLTVQSLHASNTATLDAAAVSVTVTGTTTINARGIFTDTNNGGTDTFTGLFMVAANGLFNTANNSSIVFGGGITNDGTISHTAAAGAVTLATAGAKAITGGGSTTFSNVSVASGVAATVSTTTDIAVTGTLTFLTNTVNSSLTLNSAITLTAGAVTMTDPTGSFTQTITVNAGTLSLTGNLTMADTGGATETNNLVVNSGGTVTANGNIVTNGSAATENLITLAGTGILNISGTFGTSNTFTASSTSTVRWFGDNTNFRSLTYGNLIIEIPATATANRTRTSTAAVVVQGTLTIQSLHASNTASFDAAGFSYTSNAATVINARGLFVDSNNAGTNTFTGGVTIAPAGTLSSNNTSFFIFSGDIDNDGTIALTANAPVSFTAAGTQDISGSGSFTFYNFSNSAGGNLTINTTTDITINSNLAWTTNSLVVLGASANIVMGSTASFSGNNTTNRYIQVDETSSSGGQLKQTTNGAVTGSGSWRILYPIGTATGGYSPMNLSAATIGGSAPVGGSVLAVKAIYGPSVTGQMRRQFRVVITGNSGSAVTTTMASETFSYSSATDISTGDVVGNYTNRWYLSFANGTWFNNLTGTAPGSNVGTLYTYSVTTAEPLSDGTYYFALGNSTAFTNTWYSYQNGNWSDPDVWTLDPSGTTLNNPLTQTPLSGDQVVILSNITVTCNVSSLTLSTVTIQSSAILDMGVTTGHNFGLVYGSGLLRIAGTASAVNLPGGTYTAFVATTGGTVEYYASSAGTYAVSASQTTYNNLLFSNSSNTAVVFSTSPTGTVNSVANSLLINGDLNITQTSGTGTVTWQINDATSTQRFITINGDLTVSVSGKIKAGTGGSGTTTPHSLTLYGDFVNNGTVQFLDNTDANFSTSNTPGIAPATATQTLGLRGNTVNVTLKGTVDQSVSCNSQTDFYRLIVDKGTTQQALAVVNSTAIYNLRLFGPVNLGSAETVNNFADGPTTTSNNALSIANGTLELTGTLTIPILTVPGSCITPYGGGTHCNNYFAIPQSAGFWLNGAGLNITVADAVTTGKDDQRLLVGGLLKVTDGNLDCGFSKGINSGAAGVVVVDGGTVKATQIRPTTTSTDNFAYAQSGGVVTIGNIAVGSPSTNNTYGRVSIHSATSSFQMSGGTLEIYNPTSAANGGLEILATNYSVSGGLIKAHIPSSGSDFGIYTTSPLYDVEVYRDGTTGTNYATLQLALTVLNSLTLKTSSSPTFNCNNKNLTIGKDLDIQTGAKLNTGIQTTASGVGANTITFNGSGAQAWKLNNGASSLSNLTTVVMTKTTGSVLTLSGTALPSNIPSISTAFTLNSGTLADGGATIPVTGTLSNSATITGTGVVYYNNAGASTIGGSGGTFAGLSINTSATVTLSGDQTVTNTLRLLQTNSTLYIASYALSADKIYSDATTGSAFDYRKRIRTAGLRNDGGFTLKSYSYTAPSTGLLFPVGVGTTATAKDYTPIIIGVTATTHGTICVRPVTGVHPNATNTAQCLKFFWRVTSSGFSTPSSVIHNNYIFNDATLLQGTLSTYTPARYDPSTFTWSTGTAYDASATTVIALSPYTFSFGVNIDGEYTTGNLTSGVVKIFYSRGNGAWRTNTTWSNSPCTGPGTCGTAVPVGGAAGTNYPGPNSPVIIGDANNSHTVTMDGNGITSGSLYIDANSTLDLLGYVSLNFGVNTTGTGLLRLASNSFPGGDFLNFIGSTGGTVEYYGTAALATANYTIPTNSLNSFCNLTINPYSTQTITFPASSLTIHKTLTKSGAGIATTNAGSTYTLKGNFNVTAGTQNINTASGTTTITETGNCTISSGATLAVTSATGSHTFSTNGNITNNGTFNCSTVLDLTFTGSTNNSITGTTVGASTTLNKLTVNKGTDQTYSLTLDALGTLTTPTNNWLTITNGTFNFNKTGSTITLTNTATNPFTILTTAKLKASGGTIELSKVAADDSDLSLKGELEVAGGTVYVGNFSTKPANNNDIEYAATGTPKITVSAGTLYVNGAIRRPTSILSGALYYNQTGGDVTVGGQNALNSRAVFDIENNAGSVFNLKNASTLTIKKPISTSPSFSDLYLVPETASIDATSIIYMGTAGSTQSMTVNTDPIIGSLFVYDNTTVTMQNSTIRALGSVTINTAGILRTNSLNVNIGGNLTTNGTGYYDGKNGSGNTTTFDGTGTQTGTLTNTTTFLNMTVNKPSGTLGLTPSGATTSVTLTNLNILSGTLDIGSLNLLVTGDIVNNSIETASTGIVQMDGTSTTQTITSSDGQFENLTLAGSAGSKTVTVTGDMTINKALNFSVTNRYLYIGSYQLNFTSTGTISGTVSTAFIKTNGVSSDLGVVKTWAVSGTPASFIYGVGTRTNYTPITMTLTVSQSGDMSVIPVDDRHPTANTASSEPISNYYWIITRGSSIVYSATGSHIYAFPSALMGGTAGTGTLTAGYLDVASSNPGWITTEGSATTTSMNFTNSLSTNLPAVPPNDVFHYAVGTINTLPNPIIPIYSRLADPSVASAGGGSWNDVNSWTTASNGMGGVWGSIPSGNSIKILAGATINIDQSGRKAFISEINGTLALTNNKVGHNLGIIKGTGTLKTTQSKLPAGNYTTFVSTAGGTVEYVGPISMDNARTVYNNIATSGTVVTVPALDLTLNGGVTIKSGSTLNNSANRNISVGTGWTNSGGTYTTGTGMLTFNSALAGTITGSTSFYNVTVNKTNNLTLAGTGPTTITNTLTLTSGNIISVTGNKLTLPTAATITGGSSSSFIAGPMVKTMASGTTFNYPVGSVTTSNYRPAILANTTAADTWTVEYVGNDPTNQGYSHTAHTMPIQKVSMFEYWNISRVGSTASDVTLSYSTGSYLGSDIGVVANLRVVHWNTATSSWEVAPGGGTVSQLGTNITGTVTTTNQTSFSPDALGSLDADSPLPVTWLSFVAYRVNNTVELDWSTASERNNDHFEVLKSSDGKVFTSIGKVAGVGNSSQTQHYKFVDKEVSKSGTYYYRIKQVDLDGKTDMSTVVVITGEGKAFQHWAALPNPSYDNSHFHIELLDGSMSTSDDVEIQIVSASGVIVYQGSDSIERFNKKLEGLMQGFGTGVYIVQISNGQYKENFRIARM